MNKEGAMFAGQRREMDLRGFERSICAAKRVRWSRERRRVKPILLLLGVWVDFAGRVLDERFTGSDASLSAKALRLPSGSPARFCTHDAARADRLAIASLNANTGDQNS